MGATADGGAHQPVLRWGINCPGVPGVLSDYVAAYESEAYARWVLGRPNSTGQVPLPGRPLMHRDDDGVWRPAADQTPNVGDDPDTMVPPVGQTTQTTQTTLNEEITR